jgi:hypothetical protein
VRHRIGHALGIAAVLALVATYGTILRGYAQDAAPSDALVESLARVCVGESGWDTRTGDCAAIVHLLGRRAELRGVDTLAMTRAYASAHFELGRLDSRRWTADLTIAAREPRGWPAALDWRRYRERWLAIVDHVRAVLRGEVADPCAGAAEHWGAPGFTARARAAGLVRTPCGPTRNHFWCRPPRRGGPTS